MSKKYFLNIVTGPTIAFKDGYVDFTNDSHQVAHKLANYFAALGLESYVVDDYYKGKQSYMAHIQTSNPVLGNAVAKRCRSMGWPMDNFEDLSANADMTEKMTYLFHGRDRFMVTDSNFFQGPTGFYDNLSEATLAALAMTARPIIIDAEVVRDHWMANDGTPFADIFGKVGKLAAVA